MTRDAFNSERGRIERTLNMLERSSDQLLAGLPVPTSVLSEAVAFLRATEDAAYRGRSEGRRQTCARWLRRGACRGPSATGGHGARADRFGRRSIGPRR